MNNEKDKLFYSDLVYVINKLAGFEVIENEETNKRIALRHKEKGKKSNKFSDFTLELFNFIRSIGNQVGHHLQSSDLSKYPELVKEGLKQYDEIIFSPEEERYKLVDSKQNKNNNLKKIKKIENN